MPLKIDESVLRKTEIFRDVLDDANRRNGVAPDLACAIRSEYENAAKKAGKRIPKEDDDAINLFSGLGVCLRGDHVVKKPNYKTPDLITGGFLLERDSECVFIAECKFGAENPANNFYDTKQFHDLVADKFFVLNVGGWDVYAPEKKFFVIFANDKSDTAKAWQRRLKNASEGGELNLVESFVVCDLEEFRTYFL